MKDGIYLGVVWHDTMKYSLDEVAVLNDRVTFIRMYSYYYAVAKEAVERAHDHHPNIALLPGIYNAGEIVLDKGQAVQPELSGNLNAGGA